VKKLLVAAVAGFVLIGSAQAKDILPLKHGTYVADQVPCANPPLALTMQFTGNVFNFPHFSSCSVVSVHRSGNAFTVAESCEGMQSDGKSPMNGTYGVRSFTSFLLQDSGGPSTQFRWCSP
jgi:hypothetical protein